MTDTLAQTFVPKEPVYCDDYVVVKHQSEQLIVVEFPCGKQRAWSCRSFFERYRHLTWDDKDAIRSVTKERGMVLS